MKKLLLFAVAALSLAACSDDDDNTPGSSFDIISFEAKEGLVNCKTGGDVELGAVTMSLFDIGNYTYDKIFCAQAYAAQANFDDALFSTADRNVVFNSYYMQGFDAWGGIALSQLTDMTAGAASLTQQFSVWAAGGANGTKTYAVMYDSNSPSEEEYSDYLTRSGYPTIDFSEPRTVNHFYIANSTDVYNYFKGEQTDRFQVKVTGSLAGAEKGTLTETLVAGASKLSGWRKVDLSAFGPIDKLVFKVVGVDYAKDPTFFCIDEIALEKAQ